MTRRIFRSATRMVALALSCAAPALAQGPDGVTAMCLEREETAEVCDCAAQALRDQIGAEDYALYAAIGADYVARLAEGAGRVEAWTDASQAVADESGQGLTALMSQTNDIGQAYRTAIKDCRG